MSRKMIPFACLLLLFATPAMAYVGPGAGLSVFGAVVGLVGTLFLALLSYVWYPVRRLWRRMRRTSRSRH